MAVKSPSLAPRHVYRKVEMCGQQTCAHSQVPETICQDGAKPPPGAPPPAHIPTQVWATRET